MRRRAIKLKVNRQRLIDAIRAERDRRLMEYDKDLAEYRTQMRLYPKKVKEAINRHIIALNADLQEMRTMRSNLRGHNFEDASSADKGFYNRPLVGFRMPEMPRKPRKASEYSQSIGKYGFNAQGVNHYDKLIFRLELSDEVSIEVSEDDNYFQFVGE